MWRGFGGGWLEGNVQFFECASQLCPGLQTRLFSRVGQQISKLTHNSSFPAGTRQRMNTFPPERFCLAAAEL